MSSEAVIFSELQRSYSLGGALNVYQIATRKCFRTPGEKPEEIGNLDCKEVPHHLFGETLKEFVASGAVKGEMDLWGSFFKSPRTNSQNARTMSIQRTEAFSFLKAEIVGKGDQITDLSKLAFHHSDALMATKDKVTIYKEHCRFQWESPCDNHRAVQEGVNPELITSFSRSSVYRMSQVVHAFGTHHSQHFLK